MKRGSSLRRHVRLARVSAKVRRARTEFARVYELVDARSAGRCEAGAVSIWSLGDIRLFGRVRHDAARMMWRCPALAREHHHTRRPRRSPQNHRPELIIHLCARHHAMTTASYRVGRLLTHPVGDGSFACEVVQKAGKWAPA